MIKCVSFGRKHFDNFMFVILVRFFLFVFSLRFSDYDCKKHVQSFCILGTRCVFGRKWIYRKLELKCIKHSILSIAQEHFTNSYVAHWIVSHSCGNASVRTWYAF